MKKQTIIILIVMVLVFSLALTVSAIETERKIVKETGRSIIISGEMPENFYGGPDYTFFDGEKYIGYIQIYILQLTKENAVTLKFMCHKKTTDMGDRMGEHSDSIQVDYYNKAVHIPFVYSYYDKNGMFITDFVFSGDFLLKLDLIK